MMADNDDFVEISTNVYENDLIIMMMMMIDDDDQ